VGVVVVLLLRGVVVGVGLGDLGVGVFALLGYFIEIVLVIGGKIEKPRVWVGGFSTGRLLSCGVETRPTYATAPSPAKEDIQFHVMRI
jgi:hypothetical protein